MNSVDMIPDPARAGVAASQLFEDATERVAVEQWDSAATHPIQADGGAEILVQRRDLLVDEDVLAGRRANWKLPEPRYPTGALAKYANLVGSAQNGAVGDTITVRKAPPNAQSV